MKESIYDNMTRCEKEVADVLKEMGIKWAYEQPVFPDYYNYCSRHFSAVSRLIRTKLQYKSFDEYEVRDWLGHTKIETTMGYIKDAKHYYLLAPYDWVHRVLKAPNGWG